MVKLLKLGFIDSKVTVDSQRLLYFCLKVFDISQWWNLSCSYSYLKKVLQHQVVFVHSWHQSHQVSSILRLNIGKNPGLKGHNPTGASDLPGRKQVNPGERVVYLVGQEPRPDWGPRGQGSIILLYTVSSISRCSSPCCKLNFMSCSFIIEKRGGKELVGLDLGVVRGTLYWWHWRTNGQAVLCPSMLLIPQNTSNSLWEEKFKFYFKFKSIHPSICTWLNETNSYNSLLVNVLARWMEWSFLLLIYLFLYFCGVLKQQLKAEVVLRQHGSPSIPVGKCIPVTQVGDTSV